MTDKKFQETINELENIDSKFDDENANIGELLDEITALRNSDTDFVIKLIDSTDISKFKNVEGNYAILNDNFTRKELLAIAKAYKEKDDSFKMKVEYFFTLGCYFYEGSMLQNGNVDSLIREYEKYVIEDATRDNLDTKKQVMNENIRGKNAMSDDVINKLEKRFAKIIDEIKVIKEMPTRFAEDEIDELSCGLEKDIFNTYREYDNSRVVDMIYNNISDDRYNVGIKKDAKDLWNKITIKHPYEDANTPLSLGYFTTTDLTTQEMYEIADSCVNDDYMRRKAVNFFRTNEWYGEETNLLRNNKISELKQRAEKQGNSGEKYYTSIQHEEDINKWNEFAKENDVKVQRLMKEGSFIGKEIDIDI